MMKRASFLFYGSVLILLTLLGSCTLPENSPAKTTPSPTMSAEEAEILEPEDQPVYVWEVSFALEDQNNGLSIDSGGDVDWEEVQAANQDWIGIRSGNGQVVPSADGNNVEDWYLQFRVDDNIIYGGKPTSRVVIEIEYLDEGTDSFNLQYDSMSGPFMDSIGVTKTDSGELKTASIAICDAFFGNRDNGADFRLADFGDGAETIRRITMRLQPAVEGVATIQVDSCGANPFDGNPDSDAIHECLLQMCSGDTAVFTSPGGDPTYQGYLLDKTVFLMLNGAKSELTFTSSDETDHALLKATSDLKGYVVQLYSKAWVHNPGLIDNIKFQHLDLDGNRAERLCVGPDGFEGGGDDNYGSWQPECVNTSENPWDTDPWCSAGGLGMNGGFNPYDVQQDFENNLEYWSTGLEVLDVIISNVECGTALSFSGAAGRIEGVTIDTAGDHVHGSGCTSVDPDNEENDWSDGMTLTGPAHVIENNTVINPSDIGIVHFGGRDMVIRNNTVIAEEGNFGAFGGIALHPWWFGINGDYEITGNTVINNGDSNCGGIHAGINIGGHMWGMGCALAAGPSTIGDPATCSSSPTPPGPTSCSPGEFCQVWAYVPERTVFTLKDNTVTGAQINYLIGGIEFVGEFIDENNESITPRDTDWEGPAYCERDGLTRTWGIVNFAAANPALPDWTELEVYCER